MALLCDGTFVPPRKGDVLLDLYGELFRETGILLENDGTGEPFEELLRGLKGDDSLDKTDELLD